MSYEWMAAALEVEKDDDLQAVITTKHFGTVTSGISHVLNHSEKVELAGGLSLDFWAIENVEVRVPDPPELWVQQTDDQKDWKSSVAVVRQGDDPQYWVDVRAMDLFSPEKAVELAQAVAAAAKWVHEYGTPRVEEEDLAA